MPTSYTVDLKARDVGAHFDLDANDVVTVTFGLRGDGRTARRTGELRTVEITVHSGAEPVYFTTDGSDPVVRGSKSYVVPSGKASKEIVPATYGPTVVKVVSAAGASVSVEANR